MFRRLIKQNQPGIFLICSIFVCSSFMTTIYLYKKENNSYKVSKKHRIRTNDNADSEYSDHMVSESRELIQSESARMSNRLVLAMDRCGEYSKDTNISDTELQGVVWLDIRHHLAYCVVPKAGCTFWKRVMRFIARDYSRTISYPGDIDRTLVHYGRLRRIHQYKLADPVVRILNSRKHTKIFMFSRDPYARLWSVYIDKLFLPDFWRSYGPEIVSEFRHSNLEPKIQIICGNDVSFQEFIQYVLDALINGRILNEHFNPVNKQCNPCRLKFEALGKLETFQRDAEYIFNEFGLQRLADKVSYNLSIEKEVTMLIKYNFDLETEVGSYCYNRVDIAKRLWKSFQINGYISKDIYFPITDVQDIADSVNFSEIFQEKVLDTIHEQQVTKEQLTKQKREFLVKAYKGLPAAYLDMIPRLFKEDFELFDYDKYPVDIF